MIEWITDRKPTEYDGPLVYSHEGTPWHYTQIQSGQAWKPIPRCEPYVKPKRYTALVSCSGWAVFDTTTDYYCADCIPTREAAEEIANIYERTLP